MATTATAETSTDIRAVRTRNLQLGDELDNGVYLVAKYSDPEGLWVDWSDGDCGYVNPDRTYAVRRFPTSN